MIFGVLFNDSSGKVQKWVDWSKQRWVVLRGSEYRSVGLVAEQNLVVLMRLKYMSTTMTKHKRVQRQDETVLMHANSDNI